MTELRTGDPQPSWSPVAISRLTAYTVLAVALAVVALAGFALAAVAVGIASGIHFSTIAACVSLIFSALALLVWQLKVGTAFSSAPPPDAPNSNVTVLGSGGDVTNQGPGSGDPDGEPRIAAEESRRLEQLLELSTPPPKKKKPRFTHLVQVHTFEVGVTRPPIEKLLEANTKRWRFLSDVPYQDGSRTLEFVVRLRHSPNQSRLLAGIQRSARVVGVQIQALSVLRKLLP